MAGALYRLVSGFFRKIQGSDDYRLTHRLRFNTIQAATRTHQPGLRKVRVAIDRSVRNEEVADDEPRDRQ
jgi:hypothetical protein